MKKSLRFWEISLVLVCGVIVFFYTSPVPLTMRKAEKIALSEFSTNKEEFIEISSAANLNDMSFPTIWGNAPVTEIPIPDALTTMGINSIYVVDGILFFEYENSIMWTTPFGILYTKDVSNIEDWYRLLQIEDDWYYYRIVA